MTTFDVTDIEDSDDLLDDISRYLDRLPSEAHRREVELMLAAQQAQILIESNRARWLCDPVAWAWERLNVHPWSIQGQIMESVRDHKRTTVRSCNAAGKSYIGALTIAWWIDTHPPGETFVVSTAPTFAQVRAVLWREVRSLHRKGDLPGRVNNTEWINADGDIVGYGRKPADHDAVGFLGIHARYVLIVIDEACGVPKALWDATESISTNDTSRILAIGNPDDPGTEFAVAANLPDLWHVMKISAFDTPNFTGEEVDEVVSANLISPQWVEDRRTAWGEDSPLWISRVLAEFPIDSSNRAVRYSDVMSKTIAVEPPYADAAALLALQPVVLGLDVGGGSDYTVIRERRGMVAYRSWSAKTKEPDEVADLVVRAIVTTGARVVNYDAGGIGWGIGSIVKNRLKELKITGVVMNPINFGAASDEPDKYKNKRAEMVFGIGRIYSQEGAWYLGAMIDADTGQPNWETTVAQLIDQNWSLGAGGRIVIEKKEDIIARTGRSPDDSDALLLSFAKGNGPSRIERPTGQIPTGAGVVTRPARRPGGLPTRAGIRPR